MEFNGKPPFLGIFECIDRVRAPNRALGITVLTLSNVGAMIFCVKTGMMLIDAFNIFVKQSFNVECLPLITKNSKEALKNSHSELVTFCEKI